MHMAKLNRVELPQSVTPSNAESKDTNKDSSTSVGVRETILLLRKAPSLQLRILILVFDWFVCSLTYYGLTLNVGSILEGDLHLNYFILCVMEFLAYLTALLLLDRIGRKILFCSSTIVGGVACLACVVPVVTNSEAAWINIVLSNIGKFGISCSFAVIWLYTTELIPTTFRNTGIGVCSFGGRIGGIISPYIGNLYLFMGGNFGKALPMVVFGVIAVLSGVLSLFLPETHNRKLPETITEAEKIRR